MKVVTRRHRRQATELGRSARPCDLCGSANVIAMESHAVRGGTALLKLHWDAAKRTYDLCSDCGARHRTDNGLRV